MQFHTVLFEQRKFLFIASIGCRGLIVIIVVQHFHQSHCSFRMVSAVRSSFRTGNLNGFGFRIIQPYKSHDRFNLWCAGAQIQQPFLIRVLFILLMEYILQNCQSFIYMRFGNSAPDEFDLTLGRHFLYPFCITSALCFLIFHFFCEKYKDTAYLLIVTENMQHPSIMIPSDGIRISHRCK